jgi:hypothetical protein
MKTLFITAIASLALLTTSCMENKSKTISPNWKPIFPKGELGAQKTLLEMPGIQHWLRMTALTTRYWKRLLRTGSQKQLAYPSVRSDINITDGVGYHQIKVNQDKQLKRGCNTVST